MTRQWRRAVRHAACMRSVSWPSVPDYRLGLLREARRVGSAYRLDSVNTFAADGGFGGRVRRGKRRRFGLGARHAFIIMAASDVQFVSCALS